MIKENYRLANKKQLERLRPMSTKDIVEILETCDKDAKLHVVRDVMRVLANTGIRNSEFHALRKSDVDVTGRWVTIVGGRKTPAVRTLPLRPKTLDAIASLHSMNPDSPLVLGDFPCRRTRLVITRLKSMWPNLSADRLILHRVRVNFAYRLTSQGIPLGLIRYCMGRRSLLSLCRDLNLSPQAKLNVVRGNLERFTAEL